MSAYADVYGDQSGKGMVEDVFPNADENWVDTVLTREQAAAMMGMLFGGFDKARTEFADWGRVSEALKSGVSMAIEKGIMAGSLTDGELYINPQSKLKRIEGIALVENLYKALNSGTVYTRNSTQI